MLTVTPTPSDAKVKINGVAAKSLWVNRGVEATYEVSREWYETKSDRVTPNKPEQEVKVSLVRKTATVTINATPDGATVKLNGQPKKTGTFNVGENVSYEVSMEGYTTQSGSINVVEGGVTKQITLVKAGGG